MQQKLLRAVVKSIVVDTTGVLLDLNLHPPFANLADLADEAKKILAQRDKMQDATPSVGGVLSSDTEAQSRSRQFLLSWENKIYLEQVKKQILEITSEKQSL